MPMIKKLLLYAAAFKLLGGQIIKENDKWIVHFPRLLGYILAPLSLVLKALVKVSNLVALRRSNQLVCSNAVPVNEKVEEGQFATRKSIGNQHFTLRSPSKVVQVQKSMLEQLDKGSYDFEKVEPSVLFQLFDFLPEVKLSAFIDNFKRKEYLLLALNDSSFLSRFFNLTKSDQKTISAKKVFFNEQRKLGVSGFNFEFGKKLFVEMPFFTGGANMEEKLFRGRHVMALSYIGSDASDFFVKLGTLNTGKEAYLGVMDTPDTFFGFFLMIEA
eukprot:snap_masked-scaffold_94-processed-gene-0.20-mRNA-1 protein AED:0.13 eAED:1.00 QI:0/-1/0/1/-1/1/1/0/271